ncbi:MAG: EAL domain-containing protein [Eubacterium sp.]|nr:EAL domain-containing protein [Eubacterium sp.]
MGQFKENNNIIISDIPLPEDSGMSLIGYLYQAGVNDGLTPIEIEAEIVTETDRNTGLYVKSSFFAQSEKYLEKKEKSLFCMVAVDINHFRLFNQVFGRKLGDAYIRYVADMLTGYVSEYGGIAGYLGADNFVYLAPDSEELFLRMKEDAREYVRSQSLDVGYAPKFGCFRIIDENVKLVDAVDRATTAVDYVKKEYMRLLAWYDPSMDEEDDEFKLLQEVEFGLLNHEFTFYIQPKINMENGRIIGAEALSRWIRRDNTMVPPMKYIPVLEKNGFIFRLDRVLWEQVCKFQRFMIDMEYPVLPISVNVSRADFFSMDVAGYLNDLVKKYELPVDSIEIEITEREYSLADADLEDDIERIKSYGFTVAMDDFGSGYSSLSSLKEFDIDILKLDMRFLKIEDSGIKKGVNILEMIVDLANSLEIPVIMEGVEFPEQVNFLRDIGCKFAQGYYYHKPMRKEAYEDLLTDPDAVDVQGIS